MSNPLGLEWFECSVSDSVFSEYMTMARNGSSTALGAMLESFRPSLTELAEARLGVRVRRRMSSSDLVQDTMLTAGQQFEQFRGDSLTEFRRWLIELFQSRLVDGLRRHQLAEKRSQNHEDENPSLSGIQALEVSPAELAELKEEADHLLQAISFLPHEQQAIIRLRYMENHTFEEIAVQLGNSVPTVWRRFQEATETLHRLLNPEA